MRIDSLPIWERIEAAGLLEPAQMSIVRAEVATWKDAALRSLGTANPDPNVLTDTQARLVDWLVSHELLTPYQGQVLLSGRNAPLEIGPLKLVGHVKDWGLPHHYWVVEKRRANNSESFGQAALGDPQGMALFGERLNASDWAAIQRRVERLAQEKHLKSPHLLVPWGSVVAPPYCAVLAPPCVSPPKSSEPGSATETRAADVVWTAQSLAHRLAPELAKSNPAPSMKRILQWALDLATGLTELHERDLALGYWNPTSVMITANKRAVLCSLPGAFLQTPFLASTLFDGASPAGDANSLHQALGEGTTPKSTWLPLDFLPPEIVERLDQSEAARRETAIKEAIGVVRGWATPAADLYCLGSLLTLLFSEPSATETFEQRLGAKRRCESRALPPTVPGPIRLLVEKLMSPNPLLRPGATDAVQSLRGLLKQSVEPSQALFVVSPEANQLRKTCREWPGTRWTKDVETIKASEIPELIKTVQAPAILINTSGSTAESTAGIEGPTEFAGKDPSNPKPSTGGFRQRQRPKNFWSPPIIACFISGSAALVVLVWWIVAGPAGTDLTERDAPKKADVPPQNPADVVPSQPIAWNQEVVPDDGRLLWESPTVGLPLDVSHLPNNPSGLLILHQDFWRSAEVDSLLRALEGPVPSGYAAAIQAWREAYQVDAFTRTSIGQYQALDRVHHVFLLEGEQPVEVSLAGWKLIACCEMPAIVATEQTEETEAKPELYHYLLARTAGESVEAAWLQLAKPLPTDLAEGLATAPTDSVSEDTFDPTLSDIVLDERKLPVQRLLVGTTALVSSAVQNHGQTQFAGTMASLLTFSDEQRHLQLFINPVTVWNAQGQDWLGGRWQWLGQWIKDRIPTAVRMLYLSIHVLDGGETYVEVKVVGDRARPVGEVLGPMLDDLSNMSEPVKRSMLGLPRVPYWENALLRYDTMLQDVGGLTRAGQHDRVPTLNAWLRPRALSNLLATTEIYFMAIGGGGGGGGATVANNPSTTPTTSMPKDLAELLRSPLSLNVPEQDLINALVELETEIKTAHPELPFQFSIELDGNSLRLDGITQNQKITNFNQQDQSLAEILTALVLKANPDPAVTSARDPKCKLIWLIDPARPAGQIRITTRAAAEENGWTLPPELMPE
ncbi:MAG: hypothetical protein Q8M16_12830 [Pirellulaceae bacterium]|nr:hypothetical protein [Pirellulaceae bacterium]